MVAIFTGCANISTITLTSTPLSQTPSSDRALPTSTPNSTVTPIPTLSNLESENLVSEFLKNNGSCLLPCIWGITPGETTYSEAKNVFNHLGWKESDYDYYETGKDLASFSLSLRVGMYAPNNTVEKMHIGIGGNDFVGKVNYFSFRNILKTLGQPSDIFVFIGTNYGALDTAKTSFEFFLYYKNNNTLIEYTGTAIRKDDSYHLCLTTPNFHSTQVNPRSGYVSLYVGKKEQVSTPENLVRPFWVLPTYYLSVEKAFGKGVDEIYQIAIQDNEDACYDSPLIAWQQHK